MMGTPKILYIQYTNPTAYPPLEHSSQILAEKGWKVLFLGSKSRGMSNALQFLPHKNVTTRLISYCNPGWIQKLHYLYFGLSCLANSLVFRPGIVYASDAWSYPIGWCLSYWPGIHVVMHEHDTPNVTGSRVSRLMGWFRKKLAKRALTCICPQRNRSETMESELNPHRLNVVHNCPRRSELSELKPKSNDSLRLWFHGSLVPTQLPMQVLDAMAKCNFSTKLQFCGYETIGHPNYVQELLDRAKSLGLGDQVDYLGSIPTRREMFAVASECHVGLSLFAKRFREPMVGASNKPFDYLACGLTLLVPDTDEWRLFFVEEGCAIACDSERVESIADSLKWCWENRDAFGAMHNRGYELLVTEWNYENQFQQIVDLLEETLRNKSHQTILEKIT